MVSFFVGFFQFFKTKKVNNYNSTHFGTQILHTPGIIWKPNAHIKDRNNFLYCIVFLWICFAIQTASNSAFKTPCTTNLRHLGRGIVAPFSSVFLVPPVADSVRNPEQQVSEFSGAFTSCLIDLESSTYFGHNFPHRLQLEFNSSCQIILGIDRRHINLSRKFFLVDSSACLIDSDFRTYFGQNLSHILELGFDPSRQIILEQDRNHKNLPGNLISASLAASFVWSVESEFRTHIGKNLQFRLQSIYLSSQTSLYFYWDHRNRFAELITQFSVIKSSPRNYFDHNLQLRLHLELYSSIQTDFYLDWDHSNRIVDLYSDYSVVISFRFGGIRKKSGRNFNLQLRLQLEIFPSSVYLDWDNSNRVVELFSYSVVKSSRFRGSRTKFGYNSQIRLPLESDSSAGLYLQCDHSNSSLELPLYYPVGKSSRLGGIINCFVQQLPNSSIYLEQQPRVSIGWAGAAVSDMDNLHVPAQNFQTKYDQDSTNTQVVVQNTFVDTWDDGNPLMAQAVGLLNNSKQPLPATTTHKGSGGVVQRDIMTSSMDYG